MTIFGKHFVDKLSSPAQASFTITITHAMSAPQQPSRAVQAPVAAPRRLLVPVPAPRRIRGPMLSKLVLCSAPCCVQARGGERPLGPGVPQQAPVPATRAVQAPRRHQEQGGGPDPTKSNLGHHRRQEKRRKRKEEERREKERLRIDSTSSSEEEICHEMTKMALDMMTRVFSSCTWAKSELGHPPNPSGLTHN